MTSGPDAGIDAIHAIEELDTLQDYHLLHATLGEFHLQAGRLEKAQACFERAIACTSSHSEKSLLERKLSATRRFV
jgi:RNA polymerase sigma-70 factor (ECF subfamily)